MAPGGDPAWRSLGELASVGITLVVSTVIGLGAGYWGDRWLGTAPWLMLVGLLFGIAAGFVNLFRSVKRAERRMSESNHD
jgi:ATP synthase protein I